MAHLFENLVENLSGKRSRDIVFLSAGLTLLLKKRENLQCSIICLSENFCKRLFILQEVSLSKF